MNKPIKLGEWSFASKAAAKKQLREILYSVPPRSKVDERWNGLLKELFFYHPEYEQRRKGRGIVGFSVHHDIHGTTCFHVTYDDQTHEGFSFPKCLNVAAGLTSS